MRWSNITRVARGLTLMISGEAMQSGFHFALNVVLVRMLGTRDFGIFSIILVIGGLSLSYVRALTGMPASIWIGRSRGRAAANAYDVTFGSGAIFLSVLAAIGVDLLLHVWLDKGDLAGGCFVGLWSLRSYMRTAYFAYGRRNSVVLADFTFVLSGSLLASSLWFVASADVLLAAFLVLAAANAIAIVVMLLLVRCPLRISFGNQVRRRYARFSRQLGWSGLSVTVTNFQGQVVALLVTSIGGPAAYAPIAASLLLFVPLRIAATALVNMLQPQISAELARGEAAKVWGEVKLWCSITGLCALVYGAVMLAILPRIHLHMLEGVPVMLTGALAWAVYTLTVLGVTPRIILEAMAKFATVAMITGTAAVVGAALVIFLLLIAPPIWALAGGAVSELVVTVGYVVAVRRKLRVAMKAKGAAFSRG